MASVSLQKVYKCKKCGKDIYFNNNVRSKNGKVIPLSPDDSKHQCTDFKPANEFKQLGCNYCKQPIRFDKTIVSKNGKKIPLNQDGTYHNCTLSPYNLKRQGDKK